MSEWMGCVHVLSLELFVCVSYDYWLLMIFPKSTLRMLAVPKNGLCWPTPDCLSLTESIVLL